VSNHLSISHAWLAVGAYSVVFRAYSDSYPGGVSASATINVLPAPVHYVDLNSPGPLAPYNSWSTAAANVQDAVDAASVAGALVMVTNGTYVDGIRTGGKDPSPNRVVVDKPVRVASVNGPEVTVINGSGVRCVYLSAAAGLSGFTLTNGYAGSGGGIWCESSSALVTNCVLGGNSALNYGGGAYQGTLESSTFINNAASFGGAVCGGSLRNCTISNNSVQSFGGGTYGGTLDNCTITRCQSSDVGGAAAYCTLNHCALIGNSAPECGGAVDCTLNSCILTSNRSVFIYGYGGYGGGSELSTLNNCVLFGNSADLRGGGASSCMMNNCTLSGNSVSSSQGSGGGAAGCTLNNCILYYNSASLGTNYDSTSTLNYCCTTPLPTTGVGNIVSEPAFVDPVGEDFHLRLASPCIDSGTNLSPLITSDLDGRGRPIDGNGDGIAAFDIGAFEYSYEGPPILTEQPTSQTVNMGSAVSFHTTALGLSPLAYQWRYDEVGVPDATNSLLSLDAVTASQAGSYDVVVTNALGSVTSQVAVLTVIDAAPQVTLQPLDQTVFTGSNVTFTVLASGSRPLFWQWLFDGAVIQDATNASLTLPGLATDQAGTYSVTVSNALGSVTSQPARLTVLSGPPLITLQPLGQAVFAGSNVTFTVAASGSLPLFCQWQLDGTPIAGATDPSLKLTAVTTNQAGVYSVILSNALGNATSAEALLVVRVPGLSYVWQDSPNPALPYASWDTAAHVIQDAVDVAADGARVLVTNGTYRTGGRTVGASLLLNRVAIQKAIRVESVNGPEVTIIEGAPASGGGLGDDAVRCASVGTNAVLSGFTLTNGYSSSTNAGWEDQRAGGVLGFFPSIITNCLITGNAAVIGGGSFRGIFYNCLFTGNSAMEGGAGASGSFYNCAILGNSAEQDGGGVSGGVLNNCTVSGNEALSGGGASECTLLNSIVYYNSAEVSTTNYDGAVVSGSNYTGGTLRFCCTTPLGTNGWGNISDEPGFLSPGANFRLQNNSPCINAGNNNYVMGATDLDGKPRIAGGTVDIGAYEFQSPTSLLSYAWLRRYSLSLNGSADFTDSDVDGMSNWQEWRAGTDPFDPRSVLRMLTPSAGAPGVIVRWQSVSGQAYFVERSTNLSMNPAFQTIATNIIGQAGETVYSDTSAAGVGPFYYRVSVR
jgi:hypothetical protein